MDNIFIILFFMLAIALIGYSFYAASKRRKALEAWAAAKGFSFDPGKTYGIDDQYPNYGCLKKGSNRYAYNVLEGSWEAHRFLGFDYHYATHSTDSKGRRRTHHHRFSAIILSSDVPLKPLLIRSENIFDKLKGFFGYDDIDFESAEFSRAFHVSAEEKRWAYDVLHPRSMQLLLDGERFSIEFDENHVIAFRGRTYSSEDFGHAAEVIQGLLDGLPEYVIQQQKATAAKQ